MSLTVPRCVMTPFFPLPRHVQEILHIHLAGLILILGLGIILAERMQETGQADGGYWEWQKTFSVKWLTFMPAFLYVTLSTWTLALCILSFLGAVLKKWGRNSNLFRNQADNVIEVKKWKSGQIKHSLTELGSQVLWRETRCHVGSYRQDWGLSFWTRKPFADVIHFWS